MRSDENRNVARATAGLPDGPAFAASDERFRLLLDTLPFMAFVIGFDGSAEHYNQRFIDYHGYRPGEAIRDRAALLHPEDRDRLFLARTAGARAGTGYDVEARLRRSDGEYRWHRIDNKPLYRDGRIIAWLGTAVDIDDIRRAREALEYRVAERTRELEETNHKLLQEIADRRHAEAVLKESEERYRKLYNRTPLALQSVNARAELIDVNDSWLALFGHERQSVLGRSPTEFMTAESAALYGERTWPAMLASRGQVRTAEYRFIKRSGEEFDGRLMARGEFDAEGRFVRSWSAIADITEQKRAEANLRQAQKIEAVGRLTSGVAHDFNNLLTAVTGSLDLLRQRIGDDPRAARLLATALSAAEKGARLTGQLLAFARRPALSATVVDLNATVRGMHDLLQRTLGGVVRVETVLAADLWPAIADSTQIELMILNLVINARDAMPSGGVVTIQCGNVTLGQPIRPEEPEPGDYVMIAVRDTGTGIAPDVLERVFEPFYSTKEVGRGSGLGLWQVAGVAQQLGGGARIETCSGEGTCVSVYLPRASGRLEQPVWVDLAEAEDLPGRSVRPNR